MSKQKLTALVLVLIASFIVQLSLGSEIYPPLFPRRLSMEAAKSCG